MGTTIYSSGRFGQYIGGPKMQAFGQRSRTIQDIMELLHSKFNITLPNDTPTVDTEALLDRLLTGVMNKTAALDADDDDDDWGDDDPENPDIPRIAGTANQQYSLEGDGRIGTLLKRASNVSARAENEKFMASMGGMYLNRTKKGK